ncbi:hypothetical protein POPTR_013G151333v4 [Populus trichocarpa]|uniref:Uncharacterized protein n=1 Tax=Populus trichocarpa TaxID=3694 RepID=A0ACC0S4C8_POPTR|nr:hypothetical protein BDE02_13G129100 [Populus trichocarpa]KAI9383883.1 hypothetical protein POPTR_013G151333v4 [Populus trichocarpa]
MEPLKFYLNESFSSLSQHQKYLITITFFQEKLHLMPSKDHNTTP